jgi:carboxyl-terminal processing protease
MAPSARKPGLGRAGKSRRRSHKVPDTPLACGFRAGPEGFVRIICSRTRGDSLKRKAAFILTGLIVVAGIGAAVNVGRAGTGNTELYRQLDVFGDVIEQVHAHYVEKPDDDKMIEGAINGMLAALDPHSSYMNAHEYSQMQEQMSGEFGGIGIEVTSDDGILKIVSPLDGTPADKAGLLANDLIVEIDGEPTDGFTLQQAVDKMRGPVGSTIKLAIMRKGLDVPLRISVKRDVISVSPVKARAEGDVAYIKLSSFGEQTQTKLSEAIAKLKAEIGPRLAGYIIDLRNDPGGLLDQAIAVADDFLDRGNIVVTKGRNGKETERADARPGDITDHKPVIVLINAGSASASEIVAGALQDNKRAKVVGTRSFGKGTVQTVITLGKDRGALRLTTARYYTPSGRSIQAKGIEPDVVVAEELPPDLAAKYAAAKPQNEAALANHLKNPDETNADSKKANSIAYVPDDPAKDTQLQRALKMLRDGAKNATTANGRPAIGGEKRVVPN